MSIPSKTHDWVWVYHSSQRNKESAAKHVSDGKWMLFYPKSQLDAKWEQFCRLLDDNVLDGISSMKCSTAMESYRSSGDEGVIILYCDNSSFAPEIIRIGQGLFPYIQDYPKSTIYYKTSHQTSLGTISTGSLVNHTYRLTIERL